MHGFECGRCGRWMQRSCRGRFLCRVCRADEAKEPKVCEVMAACPDRNRRIEEAAARVAAEERNAAYAGPREPERKKRERPRLFRDGNPLSWLDLRTLGCAGCRRVLLGPSDEPVRADAVRRGERGARAVASLPPPVAGRVADRPVCEICFSAGVG